MSSPVTKKRALEQTLAAELRDLLTGVEVGTNLIVPSSAPLCYTLELFIPEILRRSYSEWTSESLDGFFIGSAKKTGPTAIELVGTCILISDQTVTPFQASFVISDAADSVLAHRVRVGEPGEGPLSISGPPCNSKEAKRLLNGLVGRIKTVPWVYDVSSLELASSPRPA